MIKQSLQNGQVPKAHNEPVTWNWEHVFFPQAHLIKCRQKLIKTHNLNEKEYKIIALLK